LALILKTIKKGKLGNGNGNFLRNEEINPVVIKANNNAIEHLNIQRN